MSTISLTAPTPPPSDGRSSAPTEPRRVDPSRARRIHPGLIGVVLSSVAVAAVLVSTYTTATLAELAAHDSGLATTYVDRPLGIQVALYVHIAFAAVALALGPWQFLARWRRRAPRAHRVVGRVYLVAVGIGALSGLVLSTASSVGFLGFFGFGSLAVVWAWTGWKALLAIRAGRVREHQAWMIRCFALTYAAVTLRLWIGVLIGVQLPFLGPDADFGTVFDTAYAPTPFLAWLPNLIVAEHLIRRRRLPTLRLTD